MHENARFEKIVSTRPPSISTSGATMSGASVLHVNGAHQPVFRELGIDAEAIFDHPQIVAWRTLNDRQNCTLDTTLRDGRHVRWHIKRYGATKRTPTPAEKEVRGFRLLEDAKIPALSLVGWGKLADGRSFVITD